jgi:hypothetical protein
MYGLLFVPLIVRGGLCPFMQRMMWTTCTVRSAFPSQSNTNPFKLSIQTPQPIIAMSPTISLAEFITRPVGTIVQGQVDGPPHLQEQSLSLSVKSCASIVEPWMLRHGLYTDVALDRAVSRLSEIIDTYRGDTARLTEIVRHRDLLKESEMSFATGYGGDSVWVQGKGLGEEYMTAAQEKA